MTLLADLNEQQRKAVLHEAGPLLVLAGAGSGKTRVITYRIVHLMRELNVPAEQILAVTFTNKAAGEMRERVEEMLGRAGDLPLIATFHSFCVRILRQHISALGYPNTFTIYDSNDQLTLVRRICKDLDYEGETPRSIQSSISAAKNARQDARDILGSSLDSPLLQIYDAYQANLKRAGAVDFDDLLLLTVRLFEERQDILSRYQNRFHHILVDEYQDTNSPQYKLIKLLAPPHNNVCAVGDDDQSIYRWRGADVQNILRFEQDFLDTTIIKLEQNYRSTQNILDAAHGVVEHLVARHPKKLWTDKGRGAPVGYFLGDDDGSEASFVISRLDKNNLGGHAILFRTNAQSRPFEEVLSRQSIPYQLIGGTRFYERKEIKDILAYIQLAMNPSDAVSFRRIINTPTRGIGNVTLSRLEKLAEDNEISLWEVLSTQLPFLDVGPKIKTALTKFRGLILGLMAQIEASESPSKLIDYVIRESEYVSYLTREDTQEAQERIENLQELKASARTFETGSAEDATTGFLDLVALVADTDDINQSGDKVTLMTLHCAKGLEFDRVFLVGMEEGLLPHSRNLTDPATLEEERRLCYVGMTRARDELILSSARYRRTFNGNVTNPPSRFLEDVPLAVMDNRSVERRGVKQRNTTVGANIDNIASFFKDRKISIDISKLEKHKTEPSGAEFKKGDKVFLKKYGEGTIMGFEGEGDDLRYLIYFPMVGGRKKIMAKVASLTKVER